MKKNFLKKILSLLLSIMIIFGISIETYAYEKTDNMENNVTFAIETEYCGHKENCLKTPQALLNQGLRGF